MNKEFIEALAEIERDKGVGKEVLLEAIEAALISAYKKNFGSSQNVGVNISRDSGEVRVYSRKLIVDSVADEKCEIALSEATQKHPDRNLGDFIEFEITPRDFGRIAAQTAKQVVVQRIREAERNIVFDEFIKKADDIINGKVQRIDDAGNILIDLGKAEAILINSEQVAGEKYRYGDRIRVYVVEVKKTSKGPQIIVSRTHPGLLKRLFEMEVPEIYDGIVEIKSVAREAGHRSKIAVYSNNDNVDPVGSCVGPKGLRVQAIVDELNEEKIDIIKWDKDPAIYVANALSPAKVVSVENFEMDKIAKVIVPDYQLSLAIGKEGQNARLAAKLTGWKIDIKCVTQAEEILKSRSLSLEV